MLLCLLMYPHNFFQSMYLISELQFPSWLHGSSLYWCTENLQNKASLKPEEKMPGTSQAHTLLGNCAKCTMFIYYDACTMFYTYVLCSIYYVLYMPILCSIREMQTMTWF
jgi:hypothetical protein